MQPGEFSTKIADQLFSAHPEWRPLAKWLPPSDGDHAYLYVEVPSPESADLAHPLYITTENSEVTVGIDYYHSHFDEFEEQSRDSESPDALNFIDGVISEEICLCSWWDDDQWRGSSQCRIAESPEALGISGPFNKLRIRSWRGSYDRDTGA